MQGLADGYFVIPYTIGNYLAGAKLAKVADDAPRGRGGRGGGRRRARSGCSPISGKRTRRPRSTASWASSCGSTAAWRATRRASSTALGKIPGLREEFWKNVSVPGSGQELNQSLELAGRVADFLELGELMCLRRAGARRVLRRPLPRGAPDAGRRGQARRREASATSPPGSTGRGDEARPAHVEPLTFENVRPRRCGATSEDSRCKVWRQKDRDVRGPLRPLRGARRQRRTCRSSRCSTSSTSG